MPDIEPVTFRFTLQRSELLRWILRVAVLTPRVAALSLGVTIYGAALWWSDLEPIPASGTGFLTCTIMLLCIAIALYRRTVRAGLTQTWTFHRSHMSVQAERIYSELSWDQVQRIRQVGSMFLITARSGSGVLPRRVVSADEALRFWQMATNEPAAGRVTPNLEPLEDANVAVEFCVQQAEFKSAFRVTFVRNRVLRLGLLILAVASAILLVADPLSVLIPIVCLVFIVGMLWAIARWQWKVLASALSAPQRWYFTDSEVSWSTLDGWSRAKWSFFTGCHDTRSAYVLLTPGGFLVLPKRVFTEQANDVLLRLLHVHALL